MTEYGCFSVVYKRTLILDNSGNHIMSEKFKMAAVGKFKRENSGYPYQNFWYIETFFPLFRKIITLAVEAPFKIKIREFGILKCDLNCTTVKFQL